MVKKSVIPAAGLGKRMYPATKKIPKEMLPWGRKPMIHHAIEELIFSGVKEICIVIRRGKEIIKDYLLSEKGLSKKCVFSFVYQESPQGLGDAILKAKDFVNEDPFLMVIPDQFLLYRVPPAKQISGFIKDDVSSIWTSMVKIPKKRGL
jgi:UTP--glucose-1-phosphate uridylyltransferase